MPDPRPRRPRTGSSIDEQIRDAMERGEFDDLPGAGKPIPDLNRPHDIGWWIRQKMRREGLSFLPPALEIRREVERRLVALATLSSEVAVRREIEEVNEKIRELNATLTEGPASTLVPFDVEEVVSRWRHSRKSDPPCDSSS